MQLDIRFQPDEDNSNGVVTLYRNPGDVEYATFRARRIVKSRAILFLSLETEGDYVASKIKLAKAPDASDGPDKQPHASSLAYITSQLKADQRAGYITKDQLDSLLTETYAYSYGGNEAAYGRRSRLMPGSPLHEVLATISTEQPLATQLNQVLALFEQVRLTYLALYRDKSILPFDVSFGNILAYIINGGVNAEGWRWSAIDFGDYIDNNNVIHGLDQCQTNAEFDVEDQLSTKREKANQRFFHAFHNMLFKSLESVYAKNSIPVEQRNLLQSIGEDFNPDLIPKTRDHRSTAALFAHYQQVLVDLRVEVEAPVAVAPVDCSKGDDATGMIPAKLNVDNLIWAKILLLRDNLDKVHERLVKHDGANDLQQVISGFVSEIPQEKPAGLAADQLYKQGLAVVAQLAKAEKVAEHRHGKDYRGHRTKSVLSMSPGQRAAIAFGGLLVVGLLVLLGMYLYAKHRTGSQQLLDRLTKSLVTLRVNKAKQSKAAKASGSSVLVSDQSNKEAGSVLRQGSSVG